MTTRPDARTGPWAAFRHRLRSLAPDRHRLRTEALAGLPGAISSVPDGMAAGVLAGVSPVHGLYASFAGPIAGGLTTSTRCMVITTTSAAALAAGSAISSVDESDRADALILLTVLAGALMAVAGLVRLGRYTRFVSHSVMLGFLTGVAVNIVLGQVPDLTGSSSHGGGTSVAKAFNVVIHPGDVHWVSVLVGLGALAMLVLVARAPLAMLATLVALAVPTAIVLVAHADVARVDDSGKIPTGLPFPVWPDFGLLNGPLIAGSAAVAAIVLVQGAGVAQSAPNPNGPSHADQDFIAHGVANATAGLFRGMPVGGSVGQTALNISAGGRTRWSVILSGVWMLVILAVFAPVVGVVAMPTLAAVLIYAAVGSIRPGEITTILHAGPNSQIALVSTFIATLVLPVPAAVGLGVVVSILLQLNQEAIDLKVVQLVQGPDGLLVEHPVLAVLPSDTVVVLDVYGSLFYAGSLTMQSRLPDPSGARHSVVVLRLRGRTTLGATFFSVVGAYARRLGRAGGRLYLSGLDPDLDRRLEASDRPDRLGAVWLYPATDVVGESTRAAVHDARTWIVKAGDDEHL